MLNDKIISTLTKYPEVRVIFFFDPDRDSEEEVSALNSDLFKVEFFQNNPLNLKMKFRDELADDKVFLYLPIKRPETLSLIHISEPTRLGMISYAVFCL